jgi:hypothetical protein
MIELVTLCHRFRRRCTAMLQSLQSNLLREEVILHIFSSNVEWFDVGDHPFRAVVPIPADKALHRSYWFSKWGTLPHADYTVFMDCDIWFPPTFFPAYLAALHDNPPGYYGARVLNVPYVEAERLLKTPGDITHSALAEVEEGERRPELLGKVGTFQCVPSEWLRNGSLRYPERKNAGMPCCADGRFAEAAMNLSKGGPRDRRIGSVPVYHLDHPGYETQEERVKLEL